MQGVFNPNIPIYHPPISAEGLHFSAFHYCSIVMCTIWLCMVYVYYWSTVDMLSTVASLSLPPFTTSPSLPPLPPSLFPSLLPFLPPSLSPLLL